MLTLPNMRVYIPVFDQDVDAVVDRAGDAKNPAYLRLGRGEIPLGYEVPQYAPWRQLTNGGGMIVIVAGPLAGTYIEAFQNLPEEIRPNLWIVTELPLEQNPLPTALIKQMSLEPSNVHNNCMNLFHLFVCQTKRLPVFEVL